MSSQDNWFDNTVVLSSVIGLVAIPVTGSFVPLLSIVLALMAFRMIVPEP